MQLRIDAPEISAHHAALQWDGEAWWVRDLGSRNGTWVDGVRVDSPAGRLLPEGGRVCFGDAKIAYQLTDASPPRPSARAGDNVVWGDLGVLALPSEEALSFLVSHEPEEGWTVDGQGLNRPIRDGETLEIDGVPWQLSLPEVLARTLDARQDKPVGLDFAVSTDEEYVELAVRMGSEVHRVPSRAHHYPIVLMARARLADRESGTPPAEEGWRYTERLARDLACPRNRLYLMLHRCRRDFEAIGLFASVFEKRAPTQQMRLAISDLRRVDL